MINIDSVSFIFFQNHSLETLLVFISCFRFPPQRGSWFELKPFKLTDGARKNARMLECSRLTTINVVVSIQPEKRIPAKIFLAVKENSLVVLFADKQKLKADNC